MNINRTFVLGGTGFQPVVSGILPETDDRRTYARKFFVKPKLFATDEIRQDAGFNRLEACSTIFLE